MASAEASRCLHSWNRRRKDALSGRRRKPTILKSPQPRAGEIYILKPSGVGLAKLRLLLDLLVPELVLLVLIPSVLHLQASALHSPRI